MSSKARLWQLYQSSNKFGTRPSALLGIEHPILGYFLDDAVAYFGQYIEGKLSERDKKTGKPKHKLEQLLSVRKAAQKLTQAEVALLFGMPTSEGGSQTTPLQQQL